MVTGWAQPRPSRPQPSITAPGAGVAATNRIAVGPVAAPGATGPGSTGLGGSTGVAGPRRPQAISDTASAARTSSRTPPTSSFSPDAIDGSSGPFPVHADHGAPGPDVYLS